MTALALNLMGSRMADNHDDNPRLRQVATDPWVIISARLMQIVGIPAVALIITMILLGQNKIETKIDNLQNEFYGTKSEVLALKLQVIYYERRLDKIEEQLRK